MASITERWWCWIVDISANKQWTLTNYQTTRPVHPKPQKINVSAFPDASPGKPRKPACSIDYYKTKKDHGTFQSKCCWSYDVEILYPLSPVVPVLCPDWENADYIFTSFKTILLFRHSNLPLHWFWRIQIIRVCFHWSVFHGLFHCKRCAVTQILRHGSHN